MAQFFIHLEEAVQAGDLDQLQRLLKNKDHNFYAQALSQAARTGQLECVKFLVPHCRADEIYPCGLLSAIRHNQIECINYLLPLSTQPFDYNLALNEAAAADNVELVKRLIPLCKHKLDSSALIVAINKGNREIFDVLFSVSNPKGWDYVLVAAVEDNRQEFFDILLPLFDPTYDCCAAFRMAVELGYTHFVERLYPLIDMKEVDEYFRDFEPDSYEEFYDNFYPMQTEIQKNILNNNIGEQTFKSAARKM